MKKRYQVVIIGAGPSAIFAALTLSIDIRHLGTENCAPLLRKIRSALEKKVEVFFNKPVKEILSDCLSYII